MTPYFYSDHFMSWRYFFLSVHFVVLLGIL
jgi:hypothetical protein